MFNILLSLIGLFAYVLIVWGIIAKLHKGAGTGSVSTPEGGTPSADQSPGFYGPTDTSSAAWNSNECNSDVSSDLGTGGCDVGSSGGSDGSG